MVYMNSKTVFNNLLIVWFNLHIRFIWGSVDTTTTLNNSRLGFTGFTSYRKDLNMYIYI